MSRQYQQFKQNFFRQHPPQTNHQSLSTYNNNNYTLQDNLMRNKSDDQLRIQQESHYPFDQMEHATFQDVVDGERDPFIVYGQQRQGLGQKKFSFSQNINKVKGERQVSRVNLGLNQQNFEDDYNEYNSRQSKYRVNQQFPRQRRQLDYYQYNNQRQQLGGQQKLQHEQQMRKINQELQNLRISNTNSTPKIQQEKYLHPNYVSQTTTTTMRPQSQQQMNQPIAPIRQYGVTNDNSNRVRNNDIIVTSPQKQLPVIYSSSGVKQTSSGLVMNSGNSRLIMHQQQPQAIPQSSHPIAIMQAPKTLTNSSHHQLPVQSQYIPTITNQLSSNSRLVIQSSPSTIATDPTIINNRLPQQPFNQQLIHMSNNNISSQKTINQTIVIPLQQYQRLRQQCSMWQHKYYQASQNNTINHSNQQQQQLHYLRQQNIRLKDKLNTIQQADKLAHDKVKQAFDELIRKYQESLTKQTQLLVDRFRLEIKHNERY